MPIKIQFRNRGQAMLLFKVLRRELAESGFPNIKDLVEVNGCTVSTDYRPASFDRLVSKFPEGTYRWIK